jgi:hypothetical protein
MSTYNRCDKSVEALAKELLEKFDTHKPILD